MSIELSVEGSYKDGGHDGHGEFDRFNSKFLLGFPNKQVSTVDPATGVYVQPVPGPTKIIMAIVTAVLSSTVLSQLIETQLKKEPTKIEITVTTKGQKRHAVFENPSMTKDEIEKILEGLAGGDSGCAVHVRAMKRGRH